LTFSINNVSNSTVISFSATVTPVVLSVPQGHLRLYK
jgi:hypothetical protein